MTTPHNEFQEWVDHLERPIYDGDDIPAPEDFDLIDDFDG